MATIVIGSYMVRYPLGGNLSWALQYLVGFKELGHEVYFVEKYVHPDSCYDPVKKVLSDDCSYGVKVVSDLLTRYGLEKNWCFVENGDIYHGLSKREIIDIFRRADLYLESGAHGAWNEEATLATLRVYIDVDPTFTQIKFHNDSCRGIPIPDYNYYYTNGLNIGKEGNIIPTNGIDWRFIVNPVNTHLFRRVAPPKSAAYSTIMNWKSYDNLVQYNGVSYGHKNVEFDKFKKLPQVVDVHFEIAISGINPPEEERVKTYGWLLKDAQEVTFSFDIFRGYLSSCKGEFSVCKNMYTATNSGWFSDKSAAYMASGRPVIVQETGFSDHLPTGEGLFAVNNLLEAKEAIETIEGNYNWHCNKAVDIAYEYLEAKHVLKNFLTDLSL